MTNVITAIGNAAGVLAVVLLGAHWTLKLIRRRKRPTKGERKVVERSQALEQVKKIHSLLKTRAMPAETAMEHAHAAVTSVAGNSMFMTLADGNHIVRFMIPDAVGATVGRYSEGVNTDISIALATALAGLPPA